MKKVLTYAMCLIGLFLVPQLANAQEKITGPWLWMIAPTEANRGGAASTDIDSLDKASGGKVTEEMVAKNGAKEGDAVGNLKWTKGELSAAGGDNVNEAVTKIKLGAGDINDHSAYALITIESAKEQKAVTMRVGSDDSIKVWLNGEVVHKNAIDRGASGFQDTFKVDLKAGNNLLLVKVSERGGGWSMFAGLQTDFKAAGKNYAPTEEPGDKITGPWLWMTAPSPSCGAAGTDIDWLADASKKKVTEEMVAKKGVTKKDKVDKLTWTEGEIQPTGGNNINDVINQIKLGVGDVNNTMSYAYINVVSPEDRSTRMFVGSDDSVKVWLNGEVVWKNAVNRGAGDFQDEFPAKLKKGDNPLLVKVGECGGGWSMFVGFSKEGQRGLKFNLDTPGQAVEAAGKLSTTWGKIKNAP